MYTAYIALGSNLDEPATSSHPRGQKPRRTRLDFLRAAVLDLGALDGAAADGVATLAAVEVCVASSVYESPALQLPSAAAAATEAPAHAKTGAPAGTRPESQPQPPYLNAVVQVRTTLAPGELLERCLEIERRHGRRRSEGARWESRTLDMDIVHIEGIRLTTDDLTLPHPGLAHRRFVLQPLAEIAPGLRIGPPLDASVEYLLSVCTDEAIPTRLRLDEPL